MVPATDVSVAVAVVAAPGEPPGALALPVSLGAAVSVAAPPVPDALAAN